VGVAEEDGASGQADQEGARLECQRQAGRLGGVYRTSRVMGSQPDKKNRRHVGKKV
jgi:hypothetical protein